jgi:hypothetical protein
MAKLTIDTSTHNPVLDVRVAVIFLENGEDGPGRIGVFEMDTAQGTIPLVLSRQTAASLMHELTDFLAVDPEEPVVAAND